MSGESNGNGGNAWMDVLRQGLLIAIPACLGVLLTVWAATGNIKQQLDFDRISNNSKFDSLSIRIGNQDALINSLANITGRLDEKLRAMGEATATITNLLELIRKENSEQSSDMARMGAQIDRVMDAVDAEPKGITR